MISIIVTLIKYMLILLMIIYTSQCFSVFSKKKEKTRRRVLRRQIALILLLVTMAFAAMFLQTMEQKMLILYGVIVAYIIVVQILYRLIYRKASILLLNNMCMLISIGLLILTRLNIGLATKQMALVIAATVMSMFVPVIVRKVKLLRDLTWVYAIGGILLLMFVLVLASVSGGAKLSVSLTQGGPTFQFSEFVKITYVFCLAGFFRKTNLSFRDIVTATGVAAAHVLILAVSKDLGTALVFFAAYVVLIYVATKKVRYPLAALAGGSLAAVGSYFVMAHVRVRVQAWKDPFADYQNGGYQIAQGLFAICAGGWFGTGLFEGSPDTIPVATQDFIFSAICEELGGIFAICLILVCMSCFLMIVNISLRLSKRFYKLIALGLGAEYAFQVFLTIGGNIKFIPMTGITLPLVSYGGSSIICSIMMFAIIQGLYIIREDEQEVEEQRQAAEKEAAYQEQLKQYNRGKNNYVKETTLEQKIEEETKKSLNW